MVKCWFTPPPNSPAARLFPVTNRMPQVYLTCRVAWPAHPSAHLAHMRKLQFQGDL